MIRFSRPHPGGKKIIVAGDSTGVGTGASTPEETITGFLAKDFPDADIHNVSINGSLTKDVLEQLKPHANEPADMIIISTGGNDVWAWTNRWAVERHFRQVLELAQKIAGKNVVVLFFGNEGSARVLPLFVRGPILERTGVMSRIFQKVAAGKDVTCIDLFANPKDNPFVKDPERYFAPDGLHPNGAGYRLWYNRMWRHMVEHKILIPHSEALKQINDPIYS